MRILVTGAGGFVGMAVTRHLLEHGHDVVPWTRQLVDLTDPTAVWRGVGIAGQVDGVVHLAALAAARESREDPARYFAANVGGTANLLQALAVQKPKVVFASTSAVYGSFPTGALSEDLPTRPASPYAMSKAAAEKLLAFQAIAGHAGVTILRLFNVAGALPGLVDRNPTRIINNCLRAAAGEIPHVSVNGDGGVRREFTHVADVAEAFRLAIESTVVDEWTTYNVGTGVGVSTAEVIDTARQVTGVDFDVVHNPPVDEPQELVADVSRIADELGWTPIRSNLQQVIADAWLYRSLAS
jgi:UDP-glucose 4-epimerase